MNGTRKYHPEWGNPITKEHTWYALTGKWILAQKLRILFRRGNKILMEGVTETKFGAVTEGMTIQRLPHLRIHSINNHQTQTLRQMPTRACWQDPDIAVSWGAFPVPGKYRSECSQSSIGWAQGPQWWSQRYTQGAEGVWSPIGGTSIWINQYPQSSLELNHNKRKHMVGHVALAVFVAENGLIGHQ